MRAEASTVIAEPPREDAPRHRPVLLEETLDLLAPELGATVVDCTVGMGGHARALLEAVGESGRVVGLDRDRESLARASEELEDFGGRFLPVHADYRDLRGVLEERGIHRVGAILADLGFSSFQMEIPERGFSFTADGPLDMRMDRSQGPTAADLLEEMDEPTLARILREYGEERAARRIARAVTQERARGPLRSTLQLAHVVEKAAGGRRASRIHPATRTFQALRIAVNRELEGLGEFVEEACRLLVPGGRVAFISFHSLEDRIVKQALLSQVPHCLCPPGLPRCVCGRPGIVERTTRKAVRPGAEEVQSNPRSRSARLRVVRRLPDPAALLPEDQG
jgi:16S rRNA (cytosine1402-N4)-methyltransferase